MSIIATLLGAPVTPEEAAKALNVVNGPWVQLSTDRGDSGPKATVYPQFLGSRGILAPPWLGCQFTADTVERVRECAHMVSVAADIITLAALLERGTKTEREADPAVAPKAGPPAEGWSRIVPPQKRSHYFVKGRSLCGRYGFPPEPLNPDDFTSPDDCAGCRKKLTLRKLDQVALKKGQPS